MSKHEKYHVIIDHMFYLQNELNAVVNTDWKAQQYTWTDAIMVEAVELKEHFQNWKWWKHSVVPSKEMMYQSVLELVDIWHFALSWTMQHYDQQSFDEQKAKIVEAWAVDFKPGVSIQKHINDDTFISSGVAKEVHEHIRTLVKHAANGKFDLDSFIELCSLFGMNLETLYASYLPKNVLNLFRARHNYNGKTAGMPLYVKEWKVGDITVEDNVMLANLMAAMPQDADGLINIDDLFAQLEEAYQLNF